MREILCFENVSLTYQAENGEVDALRDINFCVTEGELVSIIGPSGCGKTTLLSLAAGLVSPSAGAIFAGGDEVRGISRKVGYMLQKDSLLDWRSILGNVLLGLEIRGMKSKANVDYVQNLLKYYGLWEFRDKHPAQLSGGMRQRAALIRTLAIKPDILLLDEAFSALDYQTRLVVADDVFNILRREEKSAIIVTHDIAEGISMADRIIVLSKRPGRISMDFPLKFQNGDSRTLPPLRRRDDPRFRQYFNEIREELGINV
ncbi:MAG: ABC transporter ATP-binding protein [Defluviitaleaceae bacterium]|nr:ABC transporter ATP-binding protein [Defluviitaleaceae bacterium]